MPIPVIYGDQVDWEPLVIRFVSRQEFSESKAKQVAEFVHKWMDNAAEEDPGLWSMAKEWSCAVSENQSVDAYCEFFPEVELERLSDDVHQAFPILTEMQLGFSLPNSPTTKKFDWYDVPGGQLELDDQVYQVCAFTISFTAVTVGQFQEFLDATNYTPVPDIIEGYPGYLIESFQETFGPSPKQVLYGVTHDDAVEFCNWINMRLPTDAEMKHFFHSACSVGREFLFSGECWTSTPSGNGKFVAWNGPYHRNSLKNSDHEYRMVLPRHQYQWLDAPCFRVVKGQ